MRAASELVNDLERRIGEGSLHPGDRLPAIRAMAARTQLAPNTVAAAYRRLGERGVVIGRGRRGTFVAPRPPIGPSAAPPVPAGVADLATGNPDPLMLPELTRFVPRRRPHPVLYEQPAINPALAELAVGRLAAEGVTAHRVVLVNGALDGVERVLAAHLRPGDAVAVEDPGYPAFTDLLAAMSLRPVPVATDDRGIRADLLQALVHRVQAVLLTPRAHNPTGAALSPDRRRQLRGVLGRVPDLFIVEDDHAGPVAGAPLHTVTTGRRSWALIQSVSKALGPDLRLAFVAGDPTTLDRLEGRQALGPGWVSHLVQETALGMLTDAKVAGLVERAAATYALRRRALLDALASHGVVASGDTGLNVWVPVVDEQAAVGACLAAGYAVRAGARYRLATPPAIRITTAALDPSEAPAVAAAVASVMRRPIGQTRAG